MKLTTATVTINAITWTADLSDDRVDIYRADAWAGFGHWDGYEITQCAADLGQDVYDELSEAIMQALSVPARAR